MNRHQFQSEEHFGRNFSSKTSKDRDISSVFYYINRNEISSNQNEPFSKIEDPKFECKPNDTVDEININQHKTRLRRKEILSRGDAFDKSLEDFTDLQMETQQQFAERYVFNYSIK